MLSLKNSKILITVFCLALSLMAEAASAASVVKIDPVDKVLLVNGKRTFPVFMYAITKQYSTTGDCLSNVSGECDESATTSIEKNNNFTFKAGWVLHSTDVYWNQTINAFESKNSVMWNGHPGYADEAFFTDAKNMNTFFGYYQYDEPEIHWVPESEHSGLVALYNAAKLADPNHLVIQNTCCKKSEVVGVSRYSEGFATYMDTADVITWDTYTFFTTSYLESKGWWAIDESLYAWEQWSHQNVFNDDPDEDIDDFNKPIWTVIQANGIHSENKEIMTPKWVRANTYTALTLNVKGIGFFSYKGVYRLIENPPLQQYVNALAGELRSLNDILILPTNSFRWDQHQSDRVTFSESYDKTVLWKPRSNWNWILKNYPGDNHWYLIVVNKGNIPVSDVEVTIAPLSSAGSYVAKTLGIETAGSGRAGRTIPVVDGRFTDSFDDMVAHIYQICPAGDPCVPPVFDPLPPTPTPILTPPFITIAPITPLPTCAPSKTCANDYPNQCGLNFSNGCENILNCWDNCPDPLVCKYGACVSPSSSSSTYYPSLIPSVSWPDFFNSITGWILGIVSSLALLFLIIGGLFYVTSAGDEQRMVLAKRVIIAALVGFLLIILSASIIFELKKVL